MWCSDQMEMERKTNCIIERGEKKTKKKTKTKKEIKNKKTKKIQKNKKQKRETGNGKWGCLCKIKLNVEKTIQQCTVNVM